MVHTLDPLSITASTIAIVGAIQTAAKCINELRAVCQAPLELQLLLEEVVDLKQLLDQVQKAYNPPANGETTAKPTEARSGLNQQVKRALSELEELDQLLQRHSLRTQNRKPDFGWALGRKKADALRDDLKLLRLNLTASLSAYTA